MVTIARRVIPALPFYCFFINVMPEYANSHFHWCISKQDSRDVVTRAWTFICTAITTSIFIMWALRPLKSSAKNLFQISSHRFPLNWTKFRLNKPAGTNLTIFYSKETKNLTEFLIYVYNSTEPYWCQISSDLDSGLATNRR